LAVIAVDANGITFINRVACELMGWKQEKLIGKLIEEVFEISGKKLAETVVRCNQNNKVMASSDTILKEETTAKYLLMSTAPIHRDHWRCAYL
jgi:PAS domain S-box-containing protein